MSRLLAAIIIIFLMPFCAHAQQTEVGALKIITPLAAAIIEAGNIYLMRSGANDNLQSGPNNFCIGYAPVPDIHHPGTVPGSLGLPVIPNEKYPPVGAEMFLQTNLTPERAAAIIATGTTAIAHTNLWLYQTDELAPTASGVSFGVPSPSRLVPEATTAGGVCSPQDATLYSYAGWNLGVIFALKSPAIFSHIMCAYMINQALGPIVDGMQQLGPASCDDYHYP